MTRILFIVIFAFSFQTAIGQTVRDYRPYHTLVLSIEKDIAARAFSTALDKYSQLFQQYDFIFLRDIQMAAQLAAHERDTVRLFHLLEKGMTRGWEWKTIRKNTIFKSYGADPRWASLSKRRSQLEEAFQNSINLPVREEVKRMLVRDQLRAIKVALTPVKRWREWHTNNRFVPHNRAMVRRINEIIDESGYPGEMLIGDRSWATVIISHNEHDSIYYQSLRPKLLKALDHGQLAPIDFAQLETWRRGVDSQWKEQAFVIFEQTVTSEQAATADQLRAAINLRSIELNNKLIALEQELHMDFHLSPYHGGLITVKDN